MKKEKAYLPKKNDEFLDLDKNKKRLKFTKSFSKKIKSIIKQTKNDKSKKHLLLILGILIEIEDGFSIKLSSLKHLHLTKIEYGSLTSYIMLIEKIKEIKKKQENRNK